MGAHPFWYTVKYRQDVDAALEELRQREFSAGRYNPVMPFISLPITPSSPAPGSRHRTIQDALDASDADGARSILDINSIADKPDFGVAAPLSKEVLESLYGTDQPTRAAVEANREFFEDIERGHAVYIVLYANGVPSELLFA